MERGCRWSALAGTSRHSAPIISLQLLLVTTLCVAERVQGTDGTGAPLTGAPLTPLAQRRALLPACSTKLCASCAKRWLGAGTMQCPSCCKTPALLAEALSQ